MSSQPDSSATMEGDVNGNASSTPFSVPTHIVECAAIRVEIWTGICMDFFSLPNTIKTDMSINFKDVLQISEKTKKTKKTANNN